MTWVIGLNGPAYVALVSDIQVTWEVEGTRKYADILKKSYVIAPNAIVGFAGSVELGFEAIDVARRLNPSIDTVVDIERFSDRLRQELVSTISAQRVRELGGLRLIIAGVRTEAETIIPARSYLSFLDGFDSFKIHHSELMRTMGIGSGQTIYKHTVDELNDRQTLWRTQGSIAPEPALRFAYNIYSTLANNPQDSVSRHMHFSFIAKPGDIIEIRHLPLNPPMWTASVPQAIGILAQYWNRDANWAGGHDAIPETAKSMAELESALNQLVPSYQPICRGSLHTELDGKLVE